MSVLGEPIIMAEADTGDMGSLAYGTRVSGTSDLNGKARFSLGNSKAFALTAIRVHFTSGSGTADMSINIDSHRGTNFDTLVKVVRAVGTGTDANWRVPKDQQDEWVVEPGDDVVLTWTDPGTTIWGITVTLRPVLPDPPPQRPVIAQGL